MENIVKRFDIRDFGNRIKKLREEKKISQDELAKKVGYKTGASIFKIEQGLTDLPISKVSDLADALGVSTSFLVGWEDKEVKQKIERYEKIFQDEIFKIVLEPDKKPLYAETLMMIFEIEDLLKDRMDKYIYEFYRLYKLDYDIAESEMLLNELYGQASYTTQKFFQEKVSRKLKEQLRDSKK